MRTVFFDVDTQFDFMAPAGALYVPGAERLLPAIGRLTRFAAGRSIPVVSTADAHREDDPEFRDWPPHCVAGTLGQAKPAGTLLRVRAVVPPETGPISIEGASQIILEKRALDCFTNPNLPALLDKLNAERYVVYGVVTELCVGCAALGLARTGKRVEVVADAVRSLDPEAEWKTLAEFEAAGVDVTSLSTVIS